MPKERELLPQWHGHVGHALQPPPPDDHQLLIVAHCRVQYGEHHRCRHRVNQLVDELSQFHAHVRVDLGGSCPERGPTEKMTDLRESGGNGHGRGFVVVRAFVSSRAWDRPDTYRLGALAALLTPMVHSPLAVAPSALRFPRSHPNCPGGMHVPQLRQRSR